MTKCSLKKEYRGESLINRFFPPLTTTTISTPISRNVKMWFDGVVQAKIVNNVPISFSLYSVAKLAGLRHYTHPTYFVTRLINDALRYRSGVKIRGIHLQCLRGQKKKNVETLLSKGLGFWGGRCKMNGSLCLKLFSFFWVKRFSPLYWFYFWKIDMNLKTCWN